MKATGIVRRIDDLGCVASKLITLPKSQNAYSLQTLVI